MKSGQDFNTHGDTDHDKATPEDSNCEKTTSEDSDCEKATPEDDDCDEYILQAVTAVNQAAENTEIIEVSSDVKFNIFI